MAGTELSYDALVRSANQLQTDKQDLEAVLNQIKTIIRNLTANGGFRTPRASQLLQQTSEEWSGATLQMLSVLSTLKQELERVKTEQEQRDQALAQDVGNLRSDR
jgi:nitrogen fixation/metabolism regulation signal transduction histidine kinase